MHDYIENALEAEWCDRQQRGIEKRLRMARFPWLKTLEQFDVEYINRRFQVPSTTQIQR